METAELVVYNKQGIAVLKMARKKLDLIIEQMEKAEKERDRGELVHGFALWGGFLIGFMKKSEQTMKEVAAFGATGGFSETQFKDVADDKTPPKNEPPRLLVAPKDREFTEEERVAADQEATRILDSIQKMPGDIIH